MFETGNYVELSFSSVTPTIKATPDIYGNIAKSYNSLSFGFKTDLNDKLSLGLSVDSPYGADVFYTPLFFGATLETQATTLLARYKINPSFSVHGGISQTSVEGEFKFPGAGPLVNIAKSTDTGYVLGVAYEKPEIAARVALTYFSGSNHSDPLSDSSFNAPQAVNLDFQTGIAANTLLFGGIRWADWSKTVIVVDLLPVVTYDNDAVSYSLGIGRKFSDSFSGALTLGFEEAQDGIASALAPTDGYMSVGLGGTYTKDNMKISAGARYVAVGNATTFGLPVNTFEDNSAVAVGVKVSFTF